MIIFIFFPKTLFQAVELLWYLHLPRYIPRANREIQSARDGTSVEAFFFSIFDYFGSYDTNKNENDTTSKSAPPNYLIDLYTSLGWVKLTVCTNDIGTDSDSFRTNYRALKFWNLTIFAVIVSYIFKFSV